MKAVLVGIMLPGVEVEEFESSLEELKRLVQTLGFEVIGQVTQRRAAPSPAAAIGAGKLKELARWTGVTPEISEDEAEEESEAESTAPTGIATHVVFDHELTPNQLKNVQEATNAEVL